MKPMPTSIEEQITYLASYGYKVVPRHEFEAAADRPAGLLERMADFLANADGAVNGDYVLYDPEDDGDGFMLIGSREEIADEGARHLYGDLDLPVVS